MPPQNLNQPAQANPWADFSDGDLQDVHEQIGTLIQKGGLNPAQAKSAQNAFGALGTERMNRAMAPQRAMEAQANLLGQIGQATAPKSVQTRQVSAPEMASRKYQMPEDSLNDPANTAVMNFVQSRINEPLAKWTAAAHEAGAPLAQGAAAVSRNLPATKITAIPPDLSQNINKFGEQHPIEAGMARAVGGTAAETIADPRNLPFFFSGGASAVARRAMAAGFATQMGVSTVNKASEVGAKWDTMTPSEKAEAVTDLSMSGIMTGLAGHGTFEKPGLPAAEHISGKTTPFKIADKLPESTAVAPVTPKPIETPLAQAEPLKTAPSDLATKVQGKPEQVRTVYHGTSEKNLQSILKTGIEARPTPTKGRTPALPAGYDKGVYIGANKEIPHQNMDLENVPKNERIIIEAKMPKSAMDKSIVDPEFGLEGARIYPGSIPPEAITKIHKYDPETGSYKAVEKDDISPKTPSTTPQAKEVPDLRKMSPEERHDWINKNAYYGEHDTAFAAHKQAQELFGKDNYQVTGYINKEGKMTYGYSYKAEAQAPVVPEAAKATEAPVSSKSPQSADLPKTKDGDLTGSVGAQTAAHTNQQLTGQASIEQLTESMKSMKAPFSERVAGEAKRSLTEPFKAANVTDVARGSVDYLKSKLSDAWQRYTSLPAVTHFDDSIGRFSGNNQRDAIRTLDYVNATKKAFPDEGRRAAMSAWIDAGGDAAKLQDWASKSKGSTAKTYEAAANLSSNEKIAAQNLRNYYDDMFKKAEDAGLLEHGVENYINRIIKKDSPFTRGLRARLNSSVLQPKPGFTRQRVYDTTFDAEQAGHAVVKDVAKQVAAYEDSFGRAINSRAFIKELFSSEAKDGRPYLIPDGGGIRLTDDHIPDAYLIKPHATPENAKDYARIDHPALRKWKWATSDAEGSPVFVQGEALAHPEIAQHLKNILEPESLTRSAKVLHATARISSNLKQTIFSLSGFHQTQLGVHALGHLVNPFHPAELDLQAPTQNKLIDSGLMLMDFKAQQLFHDGLAGGLPSLVPGIGPLAHKYVSYLFQDYAPRLKMAMATKALENNLSRYKGDIAAGRITEDQIYRLTAREANNAFGMQNYDVLGRNKNIQSFMRLMMIAPDFQESRAKFVGQALKPYGAEQRLALIRIAGASYIGARILNTMLNNGDPKWDKPFSAVYKDREYTLRSIPGDIQHLVSDPRNFVYHRLNPTTVRPLVEGLTGRDQYGRPRAVTEQVSDLAKSLIPIPVQGRFDKNQQSILQSIVTSLGVSNYKYRSPAEKLAGEIAGRDRGGMSPEMQAQRDYINELRQKYVSKGLNDKDLVQEYRAGRLNFKDIVNIQKSANTPLLDYEFKQIRDPREALKVWKAANTEERKRLTPELIRKTKTYKSLPSNQQHDVLENYSQELSQIGKN